MINKDVVSIVDPGQDLGILGILLIEIKSKQQGGNRRMVIDRFVIVKLICISQARFLKNILDFRKFINLTSDITRFF